MSKIDTSSWKEFHIGDLFDIKKGTRLTKADMHEGTIPYIGASSFNNGITTYISNNENIHPGNTLTVCYNGCVGCTFYQERPFWATDDVNVLYPKFTMNKYLALFIAPLIRCASGVHQYIDKWKIEDMKNDMIKLPITADGSPDYEFMENYMKTLEIKAHNALSLLNMIQ